MTDRRAVAVKPDGKILIAGHHHLASYSTNGNEVTVTVERYFPLARLNADGTGDTNFATTNWTSLSAGNAVFLQSDGGILLSGELASSNQALPSVIRLQADGTIDPTLVGTSIRPGYAAQLCAQAPDGKIVVAWHQQSSPPPPPVPPAPPPLQRLNADGTTDPAFSAALGTSSSISAVEFQPDGKLLVLGLLFNTNSLLSENTRLPNIVRLHADGRVDPTFSIPPSPVSDVYTMKLLPDGSLLVGGEFVEIQGIRRTALARIQNTTQPLLSIGLSFGSRVLSFRGDVARTYRIEASDNLTNWATLMTLVNTNGTVTVNDPEATTHTNRFYRAVLVWP